jgi:hypothetical protein
MVEINGAAYPLASEQTFAENKGPVTVAAHESKEWKQSQACGTNDAGAWIGGCFVRGLATLKLCSAEFAFSRSGDTRLFDKRRYPRSLFGSRGRIRVSLRRAAAALPGPWAPQSRGCA